METDTKNSFHIGAHRIDATALPPGLYLVATPIGNLGDITLRALETLAACDVICCEDTRVSVRLLDRYGIRKPLRALHDHNEGREAATIAAMVRQGKSVALISDAGTPLISDPGFELVQVMANEGLMITALPGASAVLTGLQLSALASNAFSFAGFLPEKKSHRVKKLNSLATHPMTLIFYESPHRILDALEDISATMGTRQIAVARELTKLHEEVLRGTANDIHATLASRTSIKGEFVVVIAPHDETEIKTTEEEIETAIDEALLTLPAAKAAAHVAKALNLTKPDIYGRILKRKNPDEQA
jgi:16S rRNA (cytidine1402-2'-O)-methyltransferase